LDDVDEGPLVFYELTEDLYTVSPNSFIGEALSFLKARNAAEGTEGAFPQLSSEAIVAADPDVVLMADAAFVPIETVPLRAGWSGMTAVVEGRVHAVDGDVRVSRHDRLASSKASRSSRGCSTRIGSSS